MKARDWIDRAKLAQGWDSDYRAARELGVTRGAMSQIRTGDSATLGEETALKVAEALQLDPALVLADQAMERARSESARTAWAAVLQRLGGVAAGVLVAVGVSSAPAPAQAAQGAQISGNGPGSVYYVKSAGARRRRGAIAAMAAWLSPPRIGMMRAAA